MDALVLFSHGSTMCRSSEGLQAHVARLRGTGRWAAVEPAFLNHSRPDIEEAVASCIAAGADRVVIAPYFLVRGRFVTQDLPRRIAAVRAAHPELPMVPAEPLGYHDALVEAVLASAAGARPPDEWRGDLLRMRIGCEDRPNCPLRDTDGCPAMPRPAGGVE